MRANAGWNRAFVCVCTGMSVWLSVAMRACVFVVLYEEWVISR